MASVGVNVIETAALGRPFQLGMLYDCRKDALIPGITLWDPEKLQQSLQVHPKITTNFKVTASDSIEDKSNLMNIDGSLKLSVLGGLINVTGAAKYLKDTKKSFKQQRLTLHYNSTCRFEELTMTHLIPENISHHEVFNNDTATHVVTAVLYGADAFFVFDREVSSDENKSTVEGEAKVAFEKLRSISEDANSNLMMDGTQKNAVRRFTCTFYGDFQLPSNPTSFEYALKVFSDLPNLLGQKKELAVPLRVWLYPLDKLHSGASKLQKEISMDLIMAIESVIESLNTTEMKCNDLLKDSPASTFAEFHYKILQMKQNCNKYKLRLMKKLGSLLPNIRGDVMKETDLNNLLQEHDESPFRGRDLAEWLKERERESDVIKLILRQLKDAGAQIGVNIDLVLMDLEVRNLVCFTFTSLNWSDMLLLQQKTHMNFSTKEKNENSLDSEQKSWLTPEIWTALRSNLIIFKDLIDSKDRKPAKFIVSSKEMKNNPGSCILLYEHGHYEAVCFIPPSQPACPITEEVNDNSVVLKVPPSCPATVELRLLYKQKQETIWRSKPVMKDELTVTLTDLRAGTEYEIKCAALGKLNYTVYSDVISVTTEGGSLIIGIDFDAEHQSIPSTCSEGRLSPRSSESSQKQQLNQNKSEELKLRPVVKTSAEHELRSLRSNLSHLRELDLSGNILGDSGVKQLSDLLENPQCKLEKLELRSCHISDRGYADLSSALRSHPSHLRELDLSGNDITDSGMMQLSDLLEDPQCKLEKLELRSCHIIDRGYVVLSSALRSNPSLRELDLSENNISELGVKMLSALLADPQGKLEKLGLRSCDIRDSGYADLSSALRSNLSLRELDLSENNYEYSGIKWLSALLKHPQCKLEKLGLRSCNISYRDCIDLSSALRSNLSLRELDLSENNITCSGMKELSALLKCPQCKLEKLGLRSCRISDGGCADLSSALRSNPSHLRELDMSKNVITDSGMKELSDLLKHPQCKLEKLGLRSCYISNRGCADLSSALRSNPSHLRELDLSGNAITDLGIKQLSDLLEDPQCKLEKLGHSQVEIL